MQIVKLSRAVTSCCAALAFYSPVMALTGVEAQLTTSPGGHILTNLQVFSPDGQWIVFDERSDAEGAKFDSASIRRVHVTSGKVETLYESRNGAYVGVVTYNPQHDEVVFIHGPENPTPTWSYAGHHRAGMIVRAAQPGVGIALDARDITAPFTPGALRGGSHVHIYEPSGEWLSFTYQDHVLNMLGADGTHDRDQRNVGISVPVRNVSVARDHERNRDGATFTVLVTRTVNTPRPGSDDVNRAYEEGWVGRQGYLRSDASRQRHAIAFLGDTLDANGKKLTEVFVADIPEDVTRSAAGAPIEGTATRLPAPPEGTAQKRLTFTGDRKFPGIQGPRFWVRSNAAGDTLAFLMKDDAGLPQIYGVSPIGGAIRQLTRNPFPVASAFTWSPDGKSIAYAGDDSVWVTDVATGTSSRVAPRDPARPVSPLAADFAPDGRSIAYLRRVDSAQGSHNQIFVTRLAP